MARTLSAVGLLAVIALVALVALTDPSVLTAVAVIGAASTAVGCLAGVLLLRSAAVGRSARARSSRAQALRRGVEIGAVVGLVATLRIVDGLTPLTALFVVLSFAIAEYVMSSGVSASR